MKEVIENRYKCPKALWNKMSDKQKIAYNNIRSVKAEFVVHPKMLFSIEQWETLSHNFAYMASIEVK